MASHKSFATALRRVRKARGLSQEAFSDVSSRTYLSSLERDLKSPTLNKVNELAAVLDVHPLTLLSLGYGGDKPEDLIALLTQVQQELQSLAEPPSSTAT
ncbi:helix-turn-helix domain-containing protein [Acidovorax sp. NCPPB 4044]|uniref:helix-turn-helix domain-containing protein n=1 Tax=Acidovorax sp. NCPPB 4044 TaxID=2940490 RepID=UPI002303B00F|nr:helix-turn-helix transcriptional regulator [Acidovorax sp. NCPPB 4044]MDA8520134.1 helix-turn-helix domain-containing protein [Acidovorax sp. NCPPB 4044]